jgi:hypothetical protein
VCDQSLVLSDSAKNPIDKFFPTGKSADYMVIAIRD